MLVNLTLYAATDGSPLTGQTPSFLSLGRVELDNSTTSLTPFPTFVEDGGGQYHAQVDDALVLPGTTIKWVIDAGTLASARYYDGEFSGGLTPSQSVQVETTEVDFTMKRGDLLPAFEKALLDERGSRLVLTEDDTVTFRMRPVGGGVLKVNTEADIIDAGRRASYSWTGTDTSIAGLFDAEFFVERTVDMDTLPRTVPSSHFFRIEILPSLAD
jgi:hypothetical protein